MPKQNRVTSYGTIIASPDRGTFMGNRGILHDDGQNIVRPYKLKAWIICRLDFKGRQRKIMAPGRYTELFFLDEATALSAGHRPCFECRRQSALAFRDAWVAANPELADGPTPRIGRIDDTLHRERLTGEYYIKDRRQRTYRAALESLPDGAFVDVRGDPYLVLGEYLLPWSTAGYGPPTLRSASPPTVTVLTPRSTTGALAHGFRPKLHPSAVIG